MKMSAVYKQRSELITGLFLHSFVSTTSLYTELLGTIFIIERCKMSLKSNLQLALVALLVLGSISLMGKTQNNETWKFDQAKWKADCGNDREELAYALISHKALIGLEPAKVQALLGDPYWKSESSNRWGYSLRPAVSSFSDLYLTFEAGKVSECEIKSNP
ncbi:MAG: hypothetical protein HC888_05470 [Candidatus Competibacteraceae bacterium]|nr:hypothetical protein [Candidatus Competibacteraceae bacterium]